MTCRLYTGPPGAGKSLDTAADLSIALRSGKNVITNLILNQKYIGKLKGRYFYRNYEDLNPMEFVYFNEKYHDPDGSEYQTLIVIDEAQVLLNSRNYQDKDRMSWVKFITNHRHLKFKIILVTQYDRMIDKQIRAVIEEEITHKCINEYSIFKVFDAACWMLNKLPLIRFNYKFFVAVNFWCAGGVRLKNGAHFYGIGRKGRYYDTHQTAKDIYMVFPECKKYVLDRLERERMEEEIENAQQEDSEETKPDGD